MAEFAFVTRGRPASAFAPVSARVARWMLADPRRWWLQKDLATQSGLDPGRVSRIVGRLSDDGILDRRGRELRPANPDLLLDAWSDAYRFDRHDVVVGHASGGGIELARSISDRLDAVGIGHALTGLAAAWLLQASTPCRVHPRGAAAGPFGLPDRGRHPGCPPRPPLHRRRSRAEPADRRATRAGPDLRSRASRHERPRRRDEARGAAGPSVRRDQHPTPTGGVRSGDQSAWQPHAAAVEPRRQERRRRLPAATGRRWTGRRCGAGPRAGLRRARDSRYRVGGRRTRTGLTDRAHTHRGARLSDGPGLRAGCVRRAEGARVLGAGRTQGRLRPRLRDPSLALGGR